MTHDWQSTFQEMGTPLSEITFVVIDLETSGGAPHLGAAITEIGAVKVRGGVELDRFSLLINPGHAIPAFITDLTGISDDMVAHAPFIAHVLPDLQHFLGDESTVLVAQNAPFDLSFLKAAYREHQFSWPDYRVLDTAILARRVLSREEAPNCKLGTLAQVFNVSVAPTHRALDDARATVDVLHGIFERLAGYKVYTIEETLNFGKKSPSKVRPT
jgi:DNA polymerase III epsilon subunit family exonuclease